MSSSLHNRVIQPRTVIFLALLEALPAFAQAQTRVNTPDEFKAAITAPDAIKEIAFDSAHLQFDATHHSLVTPGNGDLSMRFSSGSPELLFQGSFTDGTLGTPGAANHHNGRFLTKQGYNSTGRWELTFDTNTTIRDFGVKGINDNGQWNPTGQGGAIYHYIDQTVNNPLVIGGTGNVTFLNNMAIGGHATSTRTDSNGVGGAISASIVNIEGSGTYRFENNAAIGGNVSGGGYAYVIGQGGAISASSVNFTGDGAYQFINNRAETGTANNNVSDRNAQGGAIWLGNGLSVFSSSGDMLFEGNIAKAGNATGAAANINESGTGGAIYAFMDSYLYFNKGGTVVFRNNQAIGGNADNQAKAPATGMGGAISLWKNVTLAGTADYIFEGNKAFSGHASSGGVTVGSGSGGAIFGSAVFSGTGTYLFSDNQAIGGNADGVGSDATKTGVGGAIRGAGSWDGNGTYIFNGNIAEGGRSTNGGNASISGLGGAIFTNSSTTRIVGGTFTNNKATTTNIGDVTSGRGGAIFVANEFYHSLTFTLSSTVSNTLTFKGNTHNPGGLGEVANSVYFGSVYQGNSTLTASIDVEDGAQLLMYDPMASQEDNITDPLSGTTYHNLTLNLSKTGGGTWVLAGHNDMRSASHWDITQGALHLVPTEPVTRAMNMNPAHIDMSHTDSSFTLRDGASLLLTPARSGSGNDIYHQITANEITLESGSRVALAGFSYGAMLDGGRHELLKLNTSDPSTLDNQNVIDPQDASGSILVGAYSYDYTNLHWETPDLLVLDTIENSRTLEPEPGGVPTVIAPTVIAVNTPANRMVYDHLSMRLSALLFEDRCQVRMRREQSTSNHASISDDDDFSCLNETSVWAKPYYSRSDHSGSRNRLSYNVYMPSITVGADRYFSDSVLAGIAATYGDARLRGNGASIDADVYTFSLYGGTLLARDVELGMQAAYSYASYDYARNVYGGFYYDGDYKSRAVSLSLELGKTFDIREDIEIRPWASYEFMHIKTDRLTENSPHDFALDIDDHSENIHRLWLGATLRNWINKSTFLEGELYYLGQFGDTNISSNAVFINDPTQNRFRTYGEALDKHMGGIGLRAGWYLNDNVDLSLGYDFKAGENTRTHNGSLVLRYSW